LLIIFGQRQIGPGLRLIGSGLGDGSIADRGRRQIFDGSDAAILHEILVFNRTNACLLCDHGSRGSGSGGQRRGRLAIHGVGSAERAAGITGGLGGRGQRHIGGAASALPASLAA
jgi:hypothetical protein